MQKSPKMTPEEVDKEFEKAYERACNTSQRFPPDIMLKLYAYYKQATEHTAAYIPSGKSDIKNAFKLNALLQVRGMSISDAKIAYINLVKENIPE